MQLRLMIGLTAAFAVACNGDDAPSGNSTSGADGGPMTMTPTTMTSLATEGQTNGDTADTTAGEDTVAADDTGTSTGEPLPACPGPCVELAPDGWNGPVATVDSDPLEAAPECPRTFADVAVEAFHDFAYEPAVCDCDCGEAAGTSCDLIGSLRNYGASVNCAGPIIDTFNLSAGACASTPIGGSSYVRLEPVELLSLGSCEAIPAVEKPDPTFATRVTACQPEVMQGFSCDDVQNSGCLAEPPPDPLDPQLCIWREGEHDCPDDSGYIDDRTIHSSFVDDRDCTECTCDDPVGVCDNALVTLYSSNNCTTGVTAFANGEGFCAQLSVTAATGRFVPGTPNAFCPAADVEPTGQAAPAEPITVCCAQ